MTPRLLALLVIAALSAGIAAAQPRTNLKEAAELALAKKQAEAARREADRLTREADAATNEAARARAQAAALAAQISESEAAISAAEARLRIVNGLRSRQRARLAERQEPVVRLTAALQTMARRPPALALVQPGSTDDVVRVRALLASTMPIVRERTAALRVELEQAEVLARQAQTAAAALERSREELRRRRFAFAELEATQRARSEELAESALSQSDRALAFDETARDLSQLMGTRAYQEQLRRSLATLPGPLLRPPAPGEAAPQPRQQRPATYRLPVEGRLVTGMGEISDAGVHARGLTFETRPGAPVLAPASGTIVYAGNFRSYGRVLIIEHKGGWTTTLTNLGSTGVARGARVAMGQQVGTAASRVTVELRRGGRPFPITPLLSLG